MQRTLVFALLIALFLSAGCPSAQAAAQTTPVATTTVAIPMTIGPRLLGSLLAAQAFTDPGHTAVALDEAEGCRRMVLGSPIVSTAGPRLRLEMPLSLRLGTLVGQTCLAPVDFQGFLVLYQIPRLEPGTWRLRFETQDSELLDANHQPAGLAGLAWDLAEPAAVGYLESIRIDLAPPAARMGEVFEELLPGDSPEQIARAKHFAASLRPGSMSVNDAGVRLEVLAAVEPRPALPEIAPAPLSAEERLELVRLWESLDATVVAMIHALAGEALAPADRQDLLDALLDLRYAFVARMGGGVASLEGGAESGVVAPEVPDIPDSAFIRAQFVAVWQAMRDTFRRHLGGDPSAQSSDLLGYLAFFSAADALGTLDALGPTLGIELSREGLIRMARLLGDPQTELAYLQSVDPALRRTLGFGEPIEDRWPDFDFSPAPEAPASPDGFELPEGSESSESGAHTPWRFELLTDLARLLGPAPAWAAAKTSGSAVEQASQWLFVPDKLDSWLKRVRGVLDDAAGYALLAGNIPEELKAFFPELVIAAAWQESCFRQFVDKAGKAVPLRSYNGTSVGVMQINERVWRGFYDVDKLQWEIAYNAKAGCEVLEEYLVRYALRKLGPEKVTAMQPADLAGLVYAMYNGGPGQLAKFQSRLAKGKLYASDKLFEEKYDWTVKGEFHKVSQCLIGN